MIAILNAGLGNLRSVYNAVYENGFDPEYVDDPEVLEDYSHIIVPGVGNFAAVMDVLEKGGFVEPLKSHVREGKPLLGICLGMQLLTSFGEEGGQHEGLGFIEGNVKKIDVSNDLRLPHVGWNTVSFQQDHPVLEGIKPDRDFYFVHSYEMECVDQADVLGVTDYGKKITCAVARGSAVGMQFHPEKSQRNGMAILENFCDWDGSC